MKITIRRNKRPCQFEYRASVRDICSADADTFSEAIGRLVMAFPAMFGVEFSFAEEVPPEGRTEAKYATPPEPNSALGFLGVAAAFKFAEDSRRDKDRP